MKKIKVLVADDDPAVLEVIGDVLTNAGYTAICVRDGNEVFSKVSAEKPDVILLDVMMPGIDGFMVKSWLNEDKTTAAIPVVFVTAKDTDADKIAGLNLGACDYIAKPFDNKELLTRIETVLKDRTENKPAR